MLKLKLGDRLMPFGQHKGKPIRDIPIATLDYYLGWDELSPYWRQIIQDFLATQADYHKEPADWKEGCEDYDPAEDD